MKTSQIYLILFLLSLILCRKVVPTAKDLSDHWGTSPRKDKYGPNRPEGKDIARAGKIPKSSQIKPITNYDDEINEKEIKSGNLDNTAFDASKIIEPEYASPKAKIHSTLIHKANVHYPKKYGTKTTAIKTTVTRPKKKKKHIQKTTKDILNFENKLENVKTDFDTIVELFD